MVSLKNPYLLFHFEQSFKLERLKKNHRKVEYFRFKQASLSQFNGQHCNLSPTLPRLTLTNLSSFHFLIGHRPAKWPFSNKTLELHRVPQEPTNNVSPSTKLPMHKSNSFLAIRDAC